MKLTCALMAGFVEKQHLWEWVFTSTFDALITALVDNAMQFSLQISDILKQLIFLAVVVSVVEADKPPSVDAVELVVDEALDIPFEPLGLLALFYLYLGHLIFSYFFSRRDTDTNPLAANTSLLLYGLQRLPLNPPSEHCRR